MKWKKLGLVVKPDARFDWSKTHASVPIAQHLEGDLFRIYYGSRNDRNLTQLGWSEIDLINPTQVLSTSPTPALALGELGGFDDAAIFPSHFMQVGSEHWMYYIGWMRGVSVPFYASLGLAKSQDGGKTFKRFSRAPLLERNEIDPLFTASAFVLKESAKWRMWYSSNTTWLPSENKPIARYNLKYAESADGMHWERQGIVALDFTNAGEIAFSRPSIIKDGGVYKMWYSFRGPAYRIGYAESRDGICWVRMDHLAGIDISNSSFESEMIEYPFIFTHNGRLHMLYNGNAFGREGVALAVAES